MVNHVELEPTLAFLLTSFSLSPLLPHTLHKHTHTSTPATAVLYVSPTMPVPKISHNMHMIKTELKQRLGETLCLIGITSKVKDKK